MLKKSLSERDICTRYITPAVQSAGWDLQIQIREENLGGPDELLAEDKTLLINVAEMREALKRELMDALGGEG